MRRLKIKGVPEAASALLWTPLLPLHCVAASTHVLLVGSCCWNLLVCCDQETMPNGHAFVCAFFTHHACLSEADKPLHLCVSALYHYTLSVHYKD